ncbi:hypothetical protein BaRGS_00033306 [Batillaria attramentaria]|uniref:IRS-type PTB domain-containing protein n=1 Tax=Batillaria attramentaria TaxID=370345 RepID=A0ABD0JL25_9CAEN
MDDSEDVLFQDFLYKLKSSKGGRFSRLIQEPWKHKYFVLCRHQDKLLLRYYNRKPKHAGRAHPKREITLWPSFKVEKVNNTHNRAFALELTAPERQVCLSADEQATVDLLVFLLQTQVRLRDNIREDLTEVKTEPSESFKRIGAKGANCILHASPWGLTLALQRSRTVLAQWPLKSVRYYESSGQGQFTIEAGKVAPMGEGVFTFHTLPGLDNRLYDTVDHYVVNTLDRPNQRGTSEEIEDYIREFDCLHSLTELIPTRITNTEMARLLRENWNYILPFTDPADSGSEREISPSAVAGSGASLSSQSAGAPSAGSQPIVFNRMPSASSLLRSDNSSRPLPSPHTPPSRSPRDNPAGGDGRVSGRPPPPPPRVGTSKSAKSSPRTPRSARQDSVDGVLSPLMPDVQPRRHSNPANVIHRVNHAAQYPLVRQQLSLDSGASSVPQNVSYMQREGPSSPRPASNRSSGGTSCPLTPQSPGNSGFAEAAGGEGQGHNDTPIEDWLVSASCEDLSDHMRAVVFHQRNSRRNANSATSDTVSAHTTTATSKKTHNNNDPSFIPPPFTHIQQFRSSVDWEKDKARDRSQSFDANAKTQKSHHIYGSVPSSSPNASPSIKLIRKLVSARTATKDNNLRKSLSNPNFLNLGSKEQLYQHRTHPGRSSHYGEESPKLTSQTKQKSRSLASLLPGPLRRYVSKESLLRPPSSTPSPDAHHSRQQSDDSPRTTFTNNSNFRRQYSARSLKEMSIKGIHFTEQSRSFRKPKSATRNAGAAAGSAVNASPTPRENSAVGSTEVSGQAETDATQPPVTPDTDQRVSTHSPRTSSASIVSNRSSSRDMGDVKDDKDSSPRPGLPNGVRTLPTGPGLQIRLASRSTSQSSC